VALRSSAANLTPSNDAAALEAYAGVEEGGTSSGIIGGGKARRLREEPSSFGAASEKAAELQPPKKKCKRSQWRKDLGCRIGYLAKYGLQVDSRDASSGAVAFVSCRFCLRFGREAQPELLAAGK
jgi:hypothetical protein